MWFSPIGRIPSIRFDNLILGRTTTQERWPSQGTVIKEASTCTVILRRYHLSLRTIPRIFTCVLYSVYPFVKSLFIDIPPCTCNRVFNLPNWPDHMNVARRYHHPCVAYTYMYIYMYAYIYIYIYIKKKKKKKKKNNNILNYQYYA